MKARKKIEVKFLGCQRVKSFVSVLKDFGSVINITRPVVFNLGCMLKPLGEVKNKQIKHTKNKSKTRNNTKSLSSEFLIELVWDEAHARVCFTSSPGVSAVCPGSRATALYHLSTLLPSHLRH